MVVVQQPKFLDLPLKEKIDPLTTTEMAGTDGSGNTTTSSSSSVRAERPVAIARLSLSLNGSYDKKNFKLDD